MEKAVAVIGLGKLGAPLAACLASKGCRVTGADADLRKVQAVNRGEAPVFEPGLSELLRVSAGQLRATESVREATLTSEITFIVVATPSEADGSFSLRYVLPVCEEIGRALREKPGFHLVILTSTVMPGTTGGPVQATLEQASGKQAGRGFGLCYGPEFVALGSVIRDFLNPDFVLIGESDPRSGEILEQLYRKVCENSPSVARMSLINAEITKLSVNTYVTTKISFANMLARICEKLPEANVDVVTSALGLDSRIGQKYLKGAVSYGGPCFPRDNLAFAALAKRLGAPAHLPETTDLFNRLQIELLANLVQSRLPAGGRAGILGLTYKPHTDVVEESVGLLLAKRLVAHRVTVTAYDPGGARSAAMALGQEVLLAPNAVSCIGESDVVVVTTPWPEFLDIPVEHWLRSGGPRVVIDCWRVLNHLQEADGLSYVALGRGTLKALQFHEAAAQGPA